MNNYEKDVKKSSAFLVPLVAISYCMVVPLIMLYFIYTYPPGEAKQLAYPKQARNLVSL